MPRAVAFADCTRREEAPAGCGVGGGPSRGAKVSARVLLRSAPGRHRLPGRETRGFGVRGYSAAVPPPVGKDREIQRGCRYAPPLPVNSTTPQTAVRVVGRDRLILRVPRLPVLASTEARFRLWGWGP
jgi:hypothetical protein